MSGLLETFGDGLFYSFWYFLGAIKLHVFIKKILGILGDALKDKCILAVHHDLSNSSYSKQADQTGYI
jgi:hypothetical protein